MVRVPFLLFRTLVNQLDKGHLGCVTPAGANFQNSGVSTRPLGESWTKVVKEYSLNLTVRDLPRHQAAGMKIAPFRQRDQTLCEGAELFSLGRGRLDPLMPEKRRGHIPKNRFSMGGGSIQFSALFPMSHRSRPNLGLRVLSA
jgi:hypothetical protein